MKVPTKDDIEALKDIAAAMKAANVGIDCFAEGCYVASGKFPKPLRLIEDLTEGEEGIDE